MQASRRLSRRRIFARSTLPALTVAVLVTAAAADSSTLRRVTFSATYRPTALSAAKTVSMAKVPKARAQSLARAAWPVPATAGLTASLRAAAATNAAAPGGGPTMRMQARTSVTPNTPIGGTKWDGLASGGGSCPYASGCSPPDMALAASPAWVMQGVNTSFAVYSSAGALQAGWPKTAQSLFGIPSVPGNCDPAHGNLPYTSHPRLLWDPNSNRFFASIEQVEGAFGIAPSCPHVTGYWIAVSKTADPNGAWWVYFWDLSSIFGASNTADFTTMGVTPYSLTLGGDVFNNAGTTLTHNFAYSLNKTQLVNGTGVSAQGFLDVLFNNTTLMNTIHPVLELGGRVSPTADLFVASYDINFGGGRCSSSCSGLAVFAIGNPRASQHHSPSLSSVNAATSTYSLSPDAPDGSSGGTVSVGDPRIAATPVYSNGDIWAALNTGYNTGTSVVPAIFWADLHVTLDQGVQNCSLCTSVTAAATRNQGYLQQGNGIATYDGAPTPDLDGNVFMSFNVSSTITNVSPSSAYIARRSTGPANAFPDPGFYVQSSFTNTSETAWGAYSAAAWSGPIERHRLRGR